MYWPVILIVGGLATFWLGWRLKHRRMIKMARKIPGPPCIPFIGNAHQFICQPEELIIVLKKLSADYGDVVTFWLGPDLNFLISNPEDLKLLLSTSKASFKGPQYKYMAEVLGGGILTGSGPEWRKHRKIATPNYGKRAIESYTSVFNSEVDLLMETLKTVGEEQIDIYTMIVRTTSYSVCQTLMGLTKEQTTTLPYIEKVIDESPRMYDVVFDRITRWYLQIDPLFWMTRSYNNLKHFMMMQTEFSKQIIKHRIEKLTTLAENNKEFLMNSDEDSVVNTQLSSQEAAAKISSFIILMMAYHPECQQKLYAEIKKVTGDDDKPVSHTDLKQMPYLEMVFNEVLRLFPIAAMLQRTIKEDIEISMSKSYWSRAGDISISYNQYSVSYGKTLCQYTITFLELNIGTINNNIKTSLIIIRQHAYGLSEGSCTLPAGCSFVAPIFHLHRDQRYWDNPNAFDPERFTLENVKKRNPNCYIPFSLGPMDCLGRHFGTKLIRTICVSILREYEVTSLETYEDMRVIMAMSAVPMNGFPVFLHPRKTNKPQNDF